MACFLICARHSVAQEEESQCRAPAIQAGLDESPSGTRQASGDPTGVIDIPGELIKVVVLPGDGDHGVCCCFPTAGGGLLDCRKVDNEDACTAQGRIVMDDIYCRSCSADWECGLADCREVDCIDSQCVYGPYEPCRCLSCDDGNPCTRDVCEVNGHGFAHCDHDPLSCSDCPTGTCYLGGCVSETCPMIADPVNGCPGTRVAIDLELLDCTPNCSDVTFEVLVDTPPGVEPLGVVTSQGTLACFEDQRTLYFDIPDDAPMHAVYDITIPGYMSDSPCDQVSTLVAVEPLIDLAIDSNNDGITDYLSDELIEADPDRPGRFVFCNNNNSEKYDEDGDGLLDYEDGGPDGIPDYRDGFNADGLVGTADDIVQDEEDFVPVILSISESVDLETAQIRLSYSSSPPSDTFTETGHMRLWTVPGDQPRNPAAYPIGDFLEPGVYSAPVLSFTGSRRSIQLYIEGINASSALGDQQIHVELNATGAPGSESWDCQDTVRTTVVEVRLNLQTISTWPLDELNAIHNPALIVRDEIPAIFEIQADVKPAVLAGLDNPIWQWKSRGQGRGEFLDGIGTQCQIRGIGKGAIELYLELDGAEVTTANIHTEVVEEKTVLVRVNIVQAEGQAASYIHTAEQIHAILERVNVYWRQAGIRFASEENQTVMDIPPGVTAIPLADGIFYLKTPQGVFDGQIESVASGNSPEAIVAEIGRLLQLNRSPEPFVINCYSIERLFMPANVGFSFAGLNYNPVSTPSELVIPTLSLQKLHWGTPYPGLVIDNESFELPGDQAQLFDKMKLTWAHELGHMFRLGHPVRSEQSGGGVYSPLLEWVPNQGKQNLMDELNEGLEKEDLLLRQARDIARHSLYVTRPPVVIRP